MLDVPLTELLDEQACAAWLERYLHPDGLCCPRCHSRERRVIRRRGPVPAYRCTRCQGYYTIFSGSVFAKTHQPPSKLVLMLRGIARGEPTARLARELGVSRKQMHTLRQRVQTRGLDRLRTGRL